MAVGSVRKYERASTVFTSNKSYGEWGEVLGDSVIASAILDRILHHGITLNIRGESYRMRARKAAGTAFPPPARAGGRRDLNGVGGNSLDDFGEN